MDKLIEIRTVIFRDGESWVAQCVDYDIGVQAPNMKILRSRFSAVLNAEFAESMGRTGEPFGGIDAPPQAFREMWDSCDDPLTSADGRTSKNDGHELKLEYALCA